MSDSSSVSRAQVSTTPSLRAPFPADLQGLREKMRELLALLEANPKWYGSIYFERKNAKSISVNQKQSQISENITTGIVFRIYDGYTLFEEGTDDLEPKSLLTFVQDFVKRVSKASSLTAQNNPTLTPRYYRPSVWSERLKNPLDKELLEQIPPGVQASTPVHFGIRFEQNPMEITPKSGIDHLKKLLERCRDLSVSQGLTPEDLTYLMSRQSLLIEDAIFIDRETNLSQSLYRLSLSITLMSGADRTYTRVGGLGGLEALDLPDSELLGLLHDLKGLKNAERLKPGKYRVIFGPAVSGVLAHEAFGHSQEGDTCARGRSKAWELHQSGEEVGNQHATILNNPAIYENGTSSYAAWGSYFFDEEGWLAQEQVLLDQGKLLSPMTSLTAALRLGIPRTANGKRETWANGVYTRQTNTYFSAGDKTYDQLLAQLGDGYLALHPAGGMEDPKGMGIQVGLAYLEEVRGGKPTGKLLKGPAGGDIQMTGYTPDVLNSILAKSKIEHESPQPDRAKHPINDVGGCGKYHKEFVFAGCGGPYMLLDSITLG